MGPFWGYFVCSPVRSGWLVGLVREYDRSVVFISNGADDECGVRKQPIVVVRCPLDKRTMCIKDLWLTNLLILH